MSKINSEDSPTYTNARMVEEDAILSQAAAILRNRVCNGDLFSDPKAVAEWFIHELGGQCNETFAVAFLNNRHRLIAFERLFNGTVDAAEVHPRVIAQRALLLNAAAIIMVHNHPSGDPEPSGADKVLTSRIRETMSLIGVRVLDHFVVGPTAWISFASRGLI